MNSFKNKYGNTALIAGASEGLGAAFATSLAKRGFNLVLIARRKEPLEALFKILIANFKINVTIICCDLADADATEQIKNTLDNLPIDFMVYNACASYIGHYLDTDVSEQLKIADVNIINPIKMLHYFGGEMVKRKRGGVVLMSSLAGLQGSGCLTMYGASKAFDKILAEGLWYEWKENGVDVIACCAGATTTPNYINTKPLKTSIFEPKPQLPESVVEECMKRIGTTPSFISGRSNRIASFIMQKLFSRKRSVKIMGDTTKKMYQIK